MISPDEQHENASDNDSSNVVEGKPIGDKVFTDLSSSKVQVNTNESSSVSSSHPTEVNDSHQSAQSISTTSQDEIVFDIKDPLELLFLLDDDIKDGKVKLHPWQIKYLVDFAAGGISDQQPFQSIVRAANGSGKDKYIIAPCVVWLCMRFMLSRGVVTSSSGVQLDNQTCAYITLLCENANRKWAGGKPQIWKCNYRYYECLPSRAPIICYATDEAGKAEGYHPLGFGRKMGIFVSEDKSVPDEINIALNKCTGYTHRAHVSTPGLPLGHFFDMCNTSILRNNINSIYDVKPEDYIQYHVTAFDCSHISRAYIEQMKRDLPGGEFGAAYKSQVLAEFGTTDEMVVIPYQYIWRAHNPSQQFPAPKWIPEPYNKAGLDLSDGGDETVLIIRNGNKLIAIIPFRFDNTQDTIEFLSEKFEEYGLCHPEALIFADCGGLGKPMIDDMKKRGWSNLRYVDNRKKAKEHRTYLNTGTELWFHVRKLFERNELVMHHLKDDRLIKQLSTRYYKIDQNNRHRLLSKLESRSRGYPSPDRGDAFTLAFWDYKSIIKQETSETNPEKVPYKQPPAKKPVGTFVLKSYANPNDTLKKRLGPEPDKSYLLQQIEEYNKNLRLQQITTSSN